MPALDNLTLRERVHDHLKQGILANRPAAVDTQHMRYRDVLLGVTGVDAAADDGWRGRGL